MSAKDVRFSSDARDRMLREVASKTNDLAGDGTTTATVAASII
jgi:chaperonin GroEL (HSP60 family)